MIYIKGKLDLLFENDNVSGIYYLLDDWGLGCGEVLWISGKGVGIFYWEGLWRSWRKGKSKEFWEDGESFC